MGPEAPLYLDACAATPLARAAREAMDLASELAWANPSSLHGFGLAAAESLERSRQSLAFNLGTTAESVRFCSGGTESVHLALQGIAGTLEPGRLLISAVEHPAVRAAAAQLERRGWQVQALPVDPSGLVDLEALHQLLPRPTRLVSVIGGQSEVGTIQPIERIGHLCRSAGVLFHTDAVQLAPHQPLPFDTLPIDLLSLTAHKLGGPRGIGALLVKPGLDLDPQLTGGGQERGLRAGTEPVVLAAGFAAALQQVVWERTQGVHTQLRHQRDALLERLLMVPGVTLSGPDPGLQARLPHHISLLLSTPTGEPLPGRQLVRALWQHGIAASSGSACSGASGRPGPSPVLLAMGFDTERAASGLRLSLGSWVQPQQLERVPAVLEAAIGAYGAAPA